MLMKYSLRSLLKHNSKRPSIQNCAFSHVTVLMTSVSRETRLTLKSISLPCDAFPIVL